MTTSTYCQVYAWTDDSTDRAPDAMFYRRSRGTGERLARWLTRRVQHRMAVVKVLQPHVEPCWNIVRHNILVPVSTHRTSVD